MRKSNVKIKMRLLYIILLISVTGIISSCKTPEYIPNMVNTPMFNNKGEFQANIATGTSVFDAQVAYSVTDHIGLMVNSSFADHTDDSTDEFHKHMIFEGGVGYYNKIGTKGRYEIFGGYGFGEVEGYEESFTDSYADAKFRRFFIQPAIGLSNNVFDGSFAPRICLISLKSDEYKKSEYEVFIEPVITAKVGYRYVKFIMQFGLSIPFGGADQVYFDSQPLIFNIGMHFNLGRWWDDY